MKQLDLFQVGWIGFLIFSKQIADENTFKILKIWTETSWNIPRQSIESRSYWQVITEVIITDSKEKPENKE